MKAFSVFVLSVLALGAASPGASDLASAGMKISSLRCEYLKNPAGLDVAKPRLEWQLNSDRRGERQSAYRVLVASTPELLAQETGDLWDSGKVVSDQTFGIEYAGKKLSSRAACLWKVMVWDGADEASAWSGMAQWSMGLLNAGDWQARWIGDATLADPMNRPLRPVNCYMSELAPRADARKWVTLDLGSAQPIDAVDLMPARPLKLNHDFRTVMFPVRFTVEVSNDAGFSKSRVIVDKSGRDFEAPRFDNCPFNFPMVNARYVRLKVSKLAHWDAQDYGIALGGFAVKHQGKLVSGAAAVSCSDSVESREYSKGWLGEAKQAVVFAPELKVPVANFPGIPAKQTVSRVPMLRREFALDGEVRRATLYVAARGFYEFHLNGQRVGDELLDPGYSDYERRIAYQTFDVTKLLHPGANAMGALLGYGWYAGRMNLAHLRCIDGFFPLLLAQLEIEMADGRHVVVCSDGEWRTTLSGPVRWSDLLDGEGYDSRLEMAGWDEPGFNEQEWTPAFSEPRDNVALVWPRCEPVRAIQEMHPLAVREVKPGVYVYDMGQEITGFCRLKVDGPAGTRIKVRHAEMTNADGTINVDNLWGIRAEEDYLLDGKGPHVFEPHFTYHGFRYAEVTGLAAPPAADTLTAVNIHTDVETAGDFSCSNELYNRYMKAAKWTEWNLLFDVPAGCAARSERLAWLGDIRPCVQTTMFNMDMAAFYSKYIIDIRDEQTADGRYCDVTPHTAQGGTSVCVGAPGWADAGVSLPWEEYVNYGDRRVLQEHYDSAKRWVDFVRGKNPDLLWVNARGNDWGDWLSAGTPATPKDLGATAFFAHSVDLVSDMARALGRDVEARKYGDLFGQIRKAFVKAYAAPDGKIGNDSQGAYALALRFHLLDEPLRLQAMGHLKDAIHRAEEHPTTGFWSSVEMLLALSDQGEHEAAAEMLNVRTPPSWGYMADNGTTFWESFDANKSKHYSLNHWTHSAIGEWLWRNVAGINPDPEGAGYRSFSIYPRPDDEVQSCEASYNSIRGPINVHWLEQDGVFTLDLTVPVNATATVHLPGLDESSVEEGGRPVSESEGVRFLRRDPDGSVFQVESGSYHFLVNPKGVSQPSAAGRREPAAGRDRQG